MNYLKILDPSVRLDQFFLFVYPHVGKDCNVAGISIELNPKVLSRWNSTSAPLDQAIVRVLWLLKLIVLDLYDWVKLNRL